MCRAEIPPDYLDNPIILENLEKPVDSTVAAEDYQWYYEGANGWWKYDKRSNVDIEAAYRDKQADCTLLIVGELYIIDLQNMVQLRRNDTTKRRRIRRDTTVLPAKGVAGIKMKDNRDQTKSTTESNETEQGGDPIQEENVITIPDESYNDVTSNNSIANISSDVHNISDSVVQALSSINIDEPDQPVDPEDPVTEDT
ncbi:E3 ubiquitin-protein ligase RNF146-B-like isoform X2 [Plodia interpunctella]|nr:E3 ubiquitin-protein ligase RNF146-B-like isoform X2 [Plodia interpunctella]